MTRTAAEDGVEGDDVVARLEGVCPGGRGAGEGAAGAVVPALLVVAREALVESC